MRTGPGGFHSDYQDGGGQSERGMGIDFWYFMRVVNMKKRISRELEYGCSDNTDYIFKQFLTIIFSAEIFIFFHSMSFKVTKIFDCSGYIHDFPILMFNGLYLQVLVSTEVWWNSSAMINFISRP